MNSFQAQERLFELVNSNSILIGHSLESDLKAMRLVHHKVVDTSVVFPHRLGPPYKRALKTIASEVLQLIIQEDGLTLFSKFHLSFARTDLPWRGAGRRVNLWIAVLGLNFF